MIYLDYNATTPVAPEVLSAMLPYFSVDFGNAASHTHALGWTAKQAIEEARAQVAAILNCEAQEIIFNSGATEGINTAIKGIFERYQEKGNHIITCKTEHKAVLDTCAYLERKGANITYLDVDTDGNIDLGQLQQAITPKTILVAIMYANNETGVVHPIQQIATIVHEHQSIFLCDATQAVGKISVDVQRDEIDILCLSAHKMYGPKGVGAIYVRRKNPRVSLLPLLHGGGHERGLRSGTLNTPGIVGLGVACDLSNKYLAETILQQTSLREKLEHGLSEYFPILVNGASAPRLPNTSNLIFPLKAEDILRKVKNNLAISTGSACSSAQQEPSHVLTAMGRSREEANRSIRFSIGKMSTEEDIETVIRVFQSLL